MRGPGAGRALRAFAALLIALALGAASAAAVQAAELSGTITSQRGGDPLVSLAGATVTVREQGEATVVISRETDLLGYYWIPVPEGMYDVEVTAPGYEPVLREAFDLTADRALDATLVETGHGRIHGTVRDSEGRPVPGARVEFGGGGAGTIVAFSASDGTFSLAGPQEQRAFSIVGGAPGEDWRFYVDGGVRLGPERVIEIDVPPVVPLTVRALGLADAPIPGAEVSVPWLDVEIDAGGGLAGIISSRSRDGVTDANGEFTALVLEGGTNPNPYGSRIIVAPPVDSGYRYTSQPPPPISGPTVAIVRPERVGRLALTILGAAGQHVVGAASIGRGWASNSNGRPIELTGPEAETTLTVVQGSSDQPGTWRFESDPFPLTWGMAETLQLPPTESSPVRVVAAHNGWAVEGASVRAPETVVAHGTRSISGTLRSLNQVATTDAGGWVDFQTFAGASSDPGAQGEVVPPPGSGLQPASFTIARPGETTIVELEPIRRTVRGTLRAADGTPVAGAWVSIVDARATTAADGTFSVEVPVGASQTLDLAIDENSYITTFVDVFEDQSIEIAMPRRVELTVRVLGDGDAPVAGATVDVRSSSRNGYDLGGGLVGRAGYIGGSATTDAAGEARFTPWVGGRSGTFGGNGIRVAPPAGSTYLPGSAPVPSYDADVTVEVALVRPDTAPPTISFETVPAAVGGDWWSVSRVAVQVTASDADVGTLACSVDGVARSFGQTRTSTEITGTFHVNQEGRHTAACTAVDRRGNVGSAARAVDIDLGRPAAPTATADRAPDSSNGWFGDGVTVSFADDGDPPLADGTAGSGVDPATVPAPQTYDRSGTFVASGTVADRAGRVSTAGRLTVKVDADPPTSTLTCPSSPVRLGASANARWQDADGQSGLSGSARGSVALDTSAIGIHVAEHTAVDRVGHRAGSDCQYEVVYAFVWRGGLEPAPALNAVAPGVTTLTVRFSIAGDHGLGVMASGWPRVQPIACVGGAPIGGPATATAAPLTYDPATNRYAIAWDVGADLPPGTCAALRVGLVDGIARELLFAR